MNSPKTDEQRAVALLESIEAELLAMPDADLLEGQDLAALQKQSRDRLSSAVAEAGRRRMQAAKQALQQPKAKGQAVPLTAELARQFLRKAANDERYTLAARDFEEMSDEDAIRLCQQLIELGAEPPEPDA